MSADAPTPVSDTPRFGEAEHRDDDSEGAKPTTRNGNRRSGGSATAGLAEAHDILSANRVLRLEYLGSREAEHLPDVIKGRHPAARLLQVTVCLNRREHCTRTVHGCE